MSKIRIIESDHVQIETDVSNENELIDKLYNLIKEEARVVILELPDIGIFTLGIGLPNGFLQFSKVRKV